MAYPSSDSNVMLMLSYCKFLQQRMQRYSSLMTESGPTHFDLFTKSGTTFDSDHWHGNNGLCTCWKTIYRASPKKVPHETTTFENMKITKFEINMTIISNLIEAIFYASQDFFLWISQLPLKKYSKFTKACQKHLWQLSVIRTCTPIHVEGEKWPGWDLHCCY